MRLIGRAFALALAESGFKVAATARTQAEINATAEAIVRNGGRAIAIPGDVTDRQAVERAVAITSILLFSSLSIMCGIADDTSATCTSDWIALALPLGPVTSTVYRVTTDNGIRSFLKQPRPSF